MTLQEIKSAVDSGKKVFWNMPSYEVIKDARGEYNIYCFTTRRSIGLTWMDGKTMNGSEEDFYIKDDKQL